MMGMMMSSSTTYMLLGSNIFAIITTNNADAALDILVDGIKHVPGSKLLIESASEDNKPSPPETHDTPSDQAATALVTDQKSLFLGIMIFDLTLLQLTFNLEKLTTVHRRECCQYLLKLQSSKEKIFPSQFALY
ncbi:hypothetical protein Dsin_020434 [Dipteronia sinensis]|uniref:Uncharacterized protein n=1 Tax=Dipteronia sinensis TaxID=43782 RepID=A0AAE0AAG0_9ROSI|nr:hypothetical protein Dsin_020434 [Dipteronia sinensis]